MSAPSIESVPWALSELDAIRARAADRRVALFLDYDGTLTPIVDRPEAAVLTPAMRARVARVARMMPVAVVSGRDLADVRARVGVPDITYAGSHGLDIDGPVGRHDVGSDAAERVARAAERLEERFSDEAIPGVLIERKRFGVSVHYRLVEAERVAAVEHVVGGVVKEIPGLRRHDGKKVFEVQPDVPWHKGRAVETLLDLLGGARDVHAVYVGDDRTDEDAFRALRADGTGIVVWDAPRPTAARYHLRDPNDVGTFLDRLVGA
jgi:trehalose 6-phosphate phosphatase